jgi:putative transposase
MLFAGVGPMTYWKLYYHLIWSTKYRDPVIDGQIESIVRRSIHGMAEERRAQVWAIGMMPDHVHVAISVPPRYAISEILNAFKGTTSHLLNHELKNSNNPWPGWQSEYGVVSFSERSLQGVIDYVNNQRQHHAANTLVGSLEREERDRDTAIVNGTDNGTEAPGLD